MAVVYEHNGKEMQTTVKPKKDVSDGKYRIGVWIKDSASGIGTMTYYDPNTGNFGALGHGICDSNGSLINISGGNALESEITSIRRGEKGAPGELIGVFSEGNNKIGSIDKNTDEGIFGRLNRDKLESDKAISVAERDEVHEGDASVMCNVEGDEVCEYSVSIIKINDDENSSKGMIVKVTDPRLIEKTGELFKVCRLSALIQDGKFVGQSPMCLSTIRQEAMLFLWINDIGSKLDYSVLSLKYFNQSKRRRRYISAAVIRRKVNV